MGSKLVRTGDAASVVMTNDINTTGTIEFEDDSGILFFLPAGWTTCTVTFYGKSPENDAWYPIQSWNGTDLSNLTMDAEASKAIGLPSEAFPAHQLRVVTDNSSNNAIEVGYTTKG